jgi:opacity protein-like surface antigen
MMKKVLGAVSALALMGAAGAALAAQEATGTIETFDEEQMMLILDTGDRFKLGEGVETEGLAEGTPVTVHYEEENGEWVATENRARRGRDGRGGRGRGGGGDRGRGGRGGGRVSLLHP